MPRAAPDATGRFVTLGRRIAKLDYSQVPTISGDLFIQKSTPALLGSTGHCFVQSLPLVNGYGRKNLGIRAQVV